MSLSAADLKTTLAYLKTKCLTDAVYLDFVLPSPQKFNNKADFFAVMKASNDTQKEIDTDLVRCLWMRRLRHSYSDLEAEPFVMYYHIGFSLFSEELEAKRLDETATPDAFNKLLLKTYQEHWDAIDSLLTQFEQPENVGVDNTDVIRLQQTDFTQENVICPFIPDAVGVLTNFECQVRYQFC